MNPLPILLLGALSCGWADDLPPITAPVFRPGTEAPLANPDLRRAEEPCTPGLRPPGNSEPRPGRLTLPLGRDTEVATSKGPVTVLLEPAGAAAIEAVNVQRRGQVDGPRGAGAFDRDHERVVRCTASASQKLELMQGGQVFGVFKLTNSYAQPYQIWSWDLKSSELTKRVIITHGSLDSHNGVCLRFFDAAGTETKRAIFTADTFFEEESRYRSQCGEVVGS